MFGLLSFLVLLYMTYVVSKETDSNKNSKEVFFRVVRYSNE